MSQRRIAFIPARGGSRRIPRKNLRTVGGVPLVVRTIRTLDASGMFDEIVVGTDDAEIADVAALHGAEVWVRRPVASTETIAEAVATWLAEAGLRRDDVVAIAQPTAPLLTPETVRSVVERTLVLSRGSVVTGTGERHLLWDATISPLYSARRNSDTDSEPDYYRETGALVVAHVGNLTDPTQFPPHPVEIAEIEEPEALDVDTPEDLARARAMAERRTIWLVYAHGSEIGSGHRRRCETLAAELSHHDVVLVPIESYVGAPPDLAILDVLDAPVPMVSSLRDAGARVVSLEDLGEGSRFADVTINELYERDARDRDGILLNGPRWAVLRPEFCGVTMRPIRKEGPYRVVVTFGGTDPADLTQKVVDAFAGYEGLSIELRVIVPPARPGWTLDGSHPSWRREGLTAEVSVVSAPVMAREFVEADLVVCSAGRTVHEAAACGTPVLAIAANERELLHDVCDGVDYFGLGRDALPGAIRSEVEMLLLQPEMRESMRERALAQVDGRGAERIAWIVDGLLGGVL